MSARAALQRRPPQAGTAVGEFRWPSRCATGAQEAQYVGWACGRSRQALHSQGPHGRETWRHEKVSAVPPQPLNTDGATVYACRDISRPFGQRQSCRTPRSLPLPSPLSPGPAISQHCTQMGVGHATPRALYRTQGVTAAATGGTPRSASHVCGAAQDEGSWSSFAVLFWH